MNTLKDISSEYVYSLRFEATRYHIIEFKEFSRFVDGVRYVVDEEGKRKGKIKFKNNKVNQLRYVSERLYIDKLREARWNKFLPIKRISRRIDKLCDFILTKTTG